MVRGGGKSALCRGRGETLWDTRYDGPLVHNNNGDDNVDDLSLDENKNENDHDDDGDDRDENVGNIGEGEADGGEGVGGERDPPRFRLIISYVG